MKPIFRSACEPILWLGLLLLVLGACRSSQAAALPYVDLTRRTPLPSMAVAKDPPLRMAVAAILSPQGTAESYRELADYLSQELQQPVELVQRRTYAEVNALIAAQQVDLAFVCTSAYLDGQAAQTMTLLAAPEIGGESVYHSQVIVPAASAAQSIADLRSQSFAFTDPMSLTGRVYPTYLVRQLGADPDQFFDHITFTYSHDRAIEAVAAGVVDGAAVDSLVLRYALARNPELQDRIRSIHTSPPFAIPPVVVPSALPRQKVQQIQQILLDMHQSELGRQILASLGIDRFVTIDDEAYASARQLVAQTGDLR